MYSGQGLTLSHFAGYPHLEGCEIQWGILILWTAASSSSVYRSPVRG